MQQLDAFQARRLLTYQLVLGLVLVAFALPFGSSVALSVLIGAGTCLLANALLAAWVFRTYRAQNPGLLVMRFYSAEVAKIALVIGMFGLAFATVDELHIPGLLGAYFVIQVIPTLIAAQVGNRTKK